MSTLAAGVLVARVAISAPIDEQDYRFDEGRPPLTTRRTPAAESNLRSARLARECSRRSALCSSLNRSLPALFLSALSFCSAPVMGPLAPRDFSSAAISPPSERTRLSILRTSCRSLATSSIHLRPFGSAWLGRSSLTSFELGEIPFWRRISRSRWLNFRFCGIEVPTFTTASHQLLHAHCSAVVRHCCQ